MQYLTYRRRDAVILTNISDQAKRRHWMVVLLSPEWDFWIIEIPADQGSCTGKVLTQMAGIFVDTRDSNPAIRSKKIVICPGMYWGDNWQKLSREGVRFEHLRSKTLEYKAARAVGDNADCDQGRLLAVSDKLERGWFRVLPQDDRRLIGDRF